MRTLTRKTTHFFIINPIQDRRFEERFESREPLKVFSDDHRQSASGVATEIGHHGLRLESPLHFDVGSRVRLAFPKTQDNVGCFGRIAWIRPKENGSAFICGVAVESWHGIIQGPDSWKRLKGVHHRLDRRGKGR